MDKLSTWKQKTAIFIATHLLKKHYAWHLLPNKFPILYPASHKGEKQRILILMGLHFSFTFVLLPVTQPERNVHSICYNIGAFSLP